MLRHEHVLGDVDEELRLDELLQMQPVPSRIELGHRLPSIMAACLGGSVRRRWESGGSRLAPWVRLLGQPRAGVQRRAHRFCERRHGLLHHDDRPLHLF